MYGSVILNSLNAMLYLHSLLSIDPFSLDCFCSENLQLFWPGFFLFESAFCYCYLASVAEVESQISFQNSNRFTSISEITQLHSLTFF